MSAYQSSLFRSLKKELNRGRKQQRLLFKYGRRSKVPEATFHL